MSDGFLKIQSFMYQTQSVLTYKHKLIFHVLTLFMHKISVLNRTHVYHLVKQYLQSCAGKYRKCNILSSLICITHWCIVFRKIKNTVLENYVSTHYEFSYVTKSKSQILLILSCTSFSYTNLIYWYSICILSIFVWKNLLHKQYGM